MTKKEIIKEIDNRCENCPSLKRCHEECISCDEVLELEYMLSKIGEDDE